MQNSFKAAIFDMDGVITKTANLHARAWKVLFDELREKMISSGRKGFLPMDIREDYYRYMDGIPRLDGIRIFLHSRKLDLPEGDRNAGEHEISVYGLAKRKNTLFHRILEEKGVEVFEDCAQKIRQWKKEGKKLAVISSSKNAPKIMEASGLLNEFDAMTTGLEMEKENLPGKPHPEIFLRTAKKLHVSPKETIVIEDAASGIKAAKAGGFFKVIGVAHGTSRRHLKDAGADIVVNSLSELDL